MHCGDGRLGVGLGSFRWAQLLLFFNLLLQAKPWSASPDQSTLRVYFKHELMIILLVWLTGLDTVWQSRLSILVKLGTTTLPAEQEAVKKEVIKVMPLQLSSHIPMFTFWKYWTFFFVLELPLTMGCIQRLYTDFPWRVARNEKKPELFRGHYLVWNGSKWSGRALVSMMCGEADKLLLLM